MNSAMSESVCLLEHKHGVAISIRMLKRRCIKLCLVRRKKHTKVEELGRFVQKAGSDRITNGYALAQYRECMLNHSWSRCFTNSSTDFLESIGAMAVVWLEMTTVISMF